MADAFNPSNQGAEAGGFLRLWGQPGLHNEFQVSKEYIESLHLESQNQNNNNKKKQKQAKRIAYI